MLKNFFKVIFRDLIKDKVYTSISILGLSAAVAVVIIIAAVTISFLEFDRFHSKGNHIYQAIVHNDFLDKGSENSTTTQFILGESLKNDYPEVAEAVIVSEDAPGFFIVDEKKGEEKGIFADAPFFNVFTFPVIASAGNGKTKVFKDANSVAISRSTAEKYFGSIYNAIGKPITIKRTINKSEAYVSSVFEDAPLNSSLNFNYVLPLDAALKLRPWLKNTQWPWGNFMVNTYFLLKPGVNAADFNKKIYNYFSTKEPSIKAKLFLYKFEDMFFNPPPGMGFSKMYPVVSLIIVGIVILIITGINFVNLAISRGTKKAKEVGLRKVIGSGRGSLVARFLSETIILSFGAIIFGLLAAELILPYINSTFEGRLIFSMPYSAAFILSLPVLAIVLGFISGIYPSLYLSSLSPAVILKGSGAGNKGAYLRKSLIVIQFVFSAVFIFLMMLVYNQFMYMNSRESENYCSE